MSSNLDKTVSSEAASLPSNVKELLSKAVNVQTLRWRVAQLQKLPVRNTLKHLMLEELV